MLISYTDFYNNFSDAVISNNSVEPAYCTKVKNAFHPKTISFSDDEVLDEVIKTVKSNEFKFASFAEKFVVSSKRPVKTGQISNIEKLYLKSIKSEVENEDFSVVDFNTYRNVRIINLDTDFKAGENYRFFDCCLGGETRYKYIVLIIGKSFDEYDDAAYTHIIYDFAQHMIDSSLNKYFYFRSAENNSIYVNDSIYVLGPKLTVHDVSLMYWYYYTLFTIVRKYTSIRDYDILNNFSRPIIAPACASDIYYKVLHDLVYNERKENDHIIISAMYEYYNKQMKRFVV